MKILLTGHKGFIGSNLYKKLIKENRVDTYDVLDGYIRPKELVKGKYDWVIHVGAISSTTENNIERVMDLNVSWSIELFEECVYRDINFQWSSSASVYGNSKTFSENDELNPMNLYARSKFLLEQYISKRKVDIIWQGFRYFNVYGAGEDHKGEQSSPYSKFERQAKNRGVISVFEGSENYVRDFIHVDEVCNYHVKFMNQTSSGVFNIGTGKTTSFLEVAKTVSNMHKSVIETIPFPEKLRSHYQDYTRADMTHTNRILNS